MDDLYKENILDHYQHPRNQGELTGEGVVHRRAANSGCGDEIEVDYRLEHGKIAELKWRGTGCAISQSAMSILSEWVVGKTPAEVSGLKVAGICGLMGLSEIALNRENCLTLSLQPFAADSSAASLAHQ